MKQTLAERLTGRSIQRIDAERPEFGILVQLSGDAGFMVHTAVTASLSSRSGGSVILHVSDADNQLRLDMEDGCFVSISTDFELYAVAEAYVYRDEQGYVVHN